MKNSYFTINYVVSCQTNQADYVLIEYDLLHGLNHFLLSQISWNIILVKLWLKNFNTILIRLLSIFGSNWHDNGQVSSLILMLNGFSNSAGWWAQVKAPIPIISRREKSSASITLPPDCQRGIKMLFEIS